MKYTIITSVSALVFLVIGLLIGKSNKQIEIQTVVKTNIVEKPVDRIVNRTVERIVEKPVIEYVDKYITNVVEKVVDAEIPEHYKTALVVHNKIKKSTRIKFGKLPPGIESISVNVYIGKAIENTVSESIIKDAIEIEARKIGLKIDSKSSFDLSFIAEAFEANENQYANTFDLSLSQIAYFLSDNNIFYDKRVEIWSKKSYGTLGKNVLNQKYVIENVSEKMISFCNKYLESKQNE